MWVNVYLPTTHVGDTALIPGQFLQLESEKNEWEYMISVLVIMHLKKILMLKTGYKTKSRIFFCAGMILLFVLWLLLPSRVCFLPVKHLTPTHINIMNSHPAVQW